MIIRTEFPEHIKVTQEIDKELAWINMDIRKTSKTTPFCKTGTIFIDHKGAEDKDYFAGELVHEAQHLVHDPINWINYANGIKAIANSGIENNPKRQRILANIASDIICAFRCADNDDLSIHRAKAVDKIFEETINNNTINPLTSELFGIMSKLIPTSYRCKSNLFNKVCEIIETNTERAERYKKIAQLFKPLLDRRDKCESQGKGLLDHGLERAALYPSNNDIEQAVKEAYREAKDVDDARRRLEFLRKIVGTRNKHIDYALDDRNMLKNFFETQCRKVLLSIEFPMRQTLSKVKLGTRKWSLADGISRINLKKTVFKFGVNIPLMTTRTERVLKKNVSNTIEVKPIDLVVSIDNSTSTGTPKGRMDTPADYEVTMFYALINLAKGIGQKIGFTLWSDKINYTTLPLTYGCKEAEYLKRECLTRFGGGNTYIAFALQQARNYNDKLFFVLTDGEIICDELMYAPNVFFFLIRAKHENCRMFVDKYGAEQVTKVDDLSRLPKLALSRWMRNFW